MYFHKEIVSVRVSAICLFYHYMVFSSNTKANVSPSTAKITISILALRPHDTEPSIQSLTDQISFV